MKGRALAASRFAQVPDTLLADTSVSATAVRVYAIIVRYQGRHEVAWPGLRRVAIDYGIPRSTVSDAVAELEEHGWLICERRPGTSSLYRPVEKVSGGPDTVSGAPDGVSGGPDETRVKERETGNDRTPPTPRKRGATEEHHRLATLLADLVEGNGSLRPGTGERAADVIRLMVERDGRTPEQIEAAIRWSQRDEFWRSVVLSPRKLRQHFDAMRLRAAEQRANAAGVREEDARRERRAGLRAWVEQSERERGAA